MSVNDNPNPQSALVGTSQINSCRDLILWIPYRPAALYWSQGGTTTQALLQQGEPYNFTPLLAVDANFRLRSSVYLSYDICCQWNANYPAPRRRRSGHT
ncbi:hypothetical protein DFH06DRAFT_1352763 [Mycena polygramma]|nr:hypothetical protein DFH06DRAFT_1352763 [Mycena polygramma]